MGFQTKTIVLSALESQILWAPWHQAKLITMFRHLHAASCSAGICALKIKSNCVLDVWCMLLIRVRKMCHLFSCFFFADVKKGRTSHSHSVWSAEALTTLWINTNPAWEGKHAAAQSRKSCEGLALHLISLDKNQWWMGLKDLVPSLFLAHGLSSSNIHHHPSVFRCTLSLLHAWEMGHDERQRGGGGVHLASQTNRLHAKSNCYLPFSSSISSPSHLLHWIAYLTTATRRYHNDTYTIGFLSTCVRRCRPVLAHVTVRAFIINTADGGGGHVKEVNVTESQRRPWEKTWKSWENYTDLLAVCYVKAV